MKPQRFTLRKEYFGGLVYDAKTMAVEILNPDEYEFLAAITKRLKSANTCHKARIDFFIQKGCINHKNEKYTSPSMRSVPPPKHIRKGVLSAPIRATVLGYGGEIANGKLIGDDPQCFVPLL